MAEHGDGGGGGSGAGFFLALFAAVTVAWFFAQMQKQDQPIVNNESVITDSVLDEAPEPEVSSVSAQSQTSHYEEHGVTYYLDEDGNILDVVHF